VTVGKIKLDRRFVAIAPSVRQSDCRDDGKCNAHLIVYSHDAPRHYAFEILSHRGSVAVAERDAGTP
jgi:hypothetical protein